MRPLLRTFGHLTVPKLVALVTLGVFVFIGLQPSGARQPGRSALGPRALASPTATSTPTPLSTSTTTSTVATTTSSTSAPAPAPSTTTPTTVVASVPTKPVTTPTPVAPVAAVPQSAARIVASGNAQLDALLVSLPAVLFEAGATVHYGFNPIDCCHAGGYNPGPNEVWVSQRAFTSVARLTYVTVHELSHSVHLKTARGAALTAAVAGAPSVRSGPWDVSEKVADCVAWALYPSATAGSGITYWNCPDPWRSQVHAALA